jgi:ATP-dependent DNA helicase RecG
MNLSTPIEQIPRIGPQYQRRLKKLGIKTVQDLLFHFPYRYEDFSNLVPILEVKAGQKVCVQGKILEIGNSKTWKKRMILTQAILKDNSGSIKVVWFNQPYLINVLKEGNWVCLAGKAISDKYGLYLSSPAYEKINPESNIQYPISNLIHTGRLVPVYPETEGLSSRWLRFILKPILIQLKDKIEDPLPEIVRRENQLLPIKEALFQIHFPTSINLANRAKERFSFENLFLIELYVLKERLALKKEKATSIPLNLKIIQEFIKSLPFSLTLAQKRCAFQILKDLQKSRPMNRLLEGDVGSGKTIVAMIAALNVVKGGFQVALMAPTEILAKQHFKTFGQFLNPPPLLREKLPPDELKQKWWGVKIGLLTSEDCRIGKRKVSKKEVLEEIKNGKIDILIGTHALIQENVKFGNLALVILDEQHRFGIEQRASLILRGSTRIAKLKDAEIKIPHLLSMTATPIPRTLALTVYGDLDLSLLDELPKGRKKIITKVIQPAKRKEAYGFIRNEIKRGRQVFVICPRIEPTNNQQLTTNNKKIMSWAEVKAVKEEYEKLSKIIFPDLKVGMLHGRMKTEKKEKIMRDFRNGKIDILVSTSVVEVGIDIPNANLMMIEGAERFGLSQLHQFRGRVGRGEDQAYCFLFTDSPAKKTAQRLKALLLSENGFEIAEKDLEIRGPGEIFGKRQWGIPDLAMDSLKDVFLVEKTRNVAKELLEEDPELKKYPLLREKLEQFRKRIHLE